MDEIQQLIEPINPKLPVYDSQMTTNMSNAKKFPQYIAGLSASIGALALGMGLSWTSPAGPDGIYLAKEYNMNISSTEFSWIGSLFNLGAATICVPIGILTDVIGRKNAMLILTVPFTIGWALIIWSSSVAMFNAGRFILGISGGAFCVTIPMYTAEIAEVSIRGRLGSYFELMLSAGLLLTYILGSLVKMFTLSLICGIVPLIFFITFVFMPESPSYFLQKQRDNAARKAYKRLRGRNYNIKPELEAKKEALAEDKRTRGSYLIAIRSKAAMKGLFIAYGLMLFQQLSGVDAITFYTGSLFKDAGSSIDSDTSTIIFGTLELIATFVSTLIVDRLGRRRLLMLSSIAMSASTLIFGVYSYLESNDVNLRAFAWIPLVSICVFIIMFSFGFGPIPWLMMGEIFTPQVKGFAGSSACLFNWLVAFLVTRFFRDAEYALGTHGTFWFFSFTCGLATIFVYFFVPETAGKTLEEIQKEMYGSATEV